MFDSKMLLIFLAIALVLFGTKRLRTIGSDLGAAMRGFKQAVGDGELEERGKPVGQEPGAVLNPETVAREIDGKVPTKNHA
ncbi:MAG: twin-arginine translocase TatA/TatE family subunit [Steroidobacteraceae bacterium]|jgi:sec-independent protein translocase protein TatA